MRDDRDQASVRIEIEEGGSATGVPDSAPSGSLRLPLIGGLAALGLVALLVLVARPEDSGGTDGDLNGVRAAESTTTTTSVDPTSTTVTTADAANGNESVVVAVGLGEDLRSLAPAARGWISLESSGAGRLNLKRSLDGVAWSSIDATFESPALGEDDRLIHREFMELDATDDGFAMLMMQFDMSANGVSTIHRLVSEFGVDWVVDPTFEPLSVDDSSTQLIAHEGEWVQTVDWAEPTGGPLPGLAENLVDPSRVESTCWWYREGDALVAEACDGRVAPVRLVADDFVAPERFDEIATCVDDMLNSGIPSNFTFTFTTIGFDGSRREFSEVESLLSAPMLLADGTALVLDGGNEGYATGPCADVLTVDELRPAHLTVWPAGAPESFDLEVALTAFPTFFSAPSGTAAAVPGGVRIVVDSAVWHVDLVNRDVREIVPPLEPDVQARFLERLHALTPDGSTLVRVLDREVTLVDLDTGEQVSLGEVEEQFDWIEPVLVTNTHAFVRLFGMRTRIAVIDLTLR